MNVHVFYGSELKTNKQKFRQSVYTYVRTLPEKTIELMIVTIQI